MRKGNKRLEKAASVSDSSSDDESLVKNKKARNGAGKKDGANDSDSENEKNDTNGEANDKNTKSKSRQSDKKSHKQKDDNKKRKIQSKEKSDQSDESASEEETLSKIAKTTKKSDTSSTKGKAKDNEPLSDQDESAVEGSDEEYEVEDIISHKKSHGRFLYLIRWKGFGSDSDTWETSATIENCPDVLNKYIDEHPDSLPPPSSNKSSKSKKEKSHKKPKTETLPEEIDETKDYEVDKIIDVFFKKDKSREFLIRWKGYQSTSDSWEPEEALNCADLIEKYMAKVEQAKNCVEKELRPVRKHTERFTLRTQENERRLSRRHDGKQRAVYYDAEE